MQCPLSISALNVYAYNCVAAVKKPAIMHAIKYVSAHEPTADSTASQKRERVLWSDISKTAKDGGK